MSDVPSNYHGPFWVDFVDSLMHVFEQITESVQNECAIQCLFSAQ